MAIKGPPQILLWTFPPIQFPGQTVSPQRGHLSHKMSFLTPSFPPATYCSHLFNIKMFSYNVSWCHFLLSQLLSPRSYLPCYPPNVMFFISQSQKQKQKKGGKTIFPFRKTNWRKKSIIQIQIIIFKRHTQKYGFRLVSVNYVWACGLPHMWLGSLVTLHCRKLIFLFLMGVNRK